MIMEVIAIVPGCSAADLRLLDEVPLVIVGVVPRSIALESIVGADNVARAGAITVEVILVAFGPRPGDTRKLIGRVIAVIHSLPVVGFADDAPGAVEGVGVIGEDLVHGVQVLDVRRPADAV